LLQGNWFALPAGGGQLLCNGFSLALCSSHLGLLAFNYKENWSQSYEGSSTHPGSFHYLASQILS